MNSFYPSPKGSVSPEKLDALLDKYGKIRIYMPKSNWKYIIKEPAVGPAYSPRYSVISSCGLENNLDWDGVCYVMKTWPHFVIFTNYWFYYAHLLREGTHE